MDVDTEPPMDGPGEGPQLYCKPIGVDADDASDGDDADASDADDPDGAAKRRWRLQHVREHVRVFVEEERDEKVKEGAMSTLDILLVAAGGLSVALAGGAA